jgi:hypothetical protein
MAFNIPAGHELLKQEGNYYTVRNNTTRQIDTYYIEGDPATSNWNTRLLEDSVIFQQVYYLDAFLFYKIFIHDFNGNGKPEFFAADMGEGVRTRFFENQGDFDFVEVYRIEIPMATWGFGDTDNDSLFEILTQATDTFRLYEQTQVNDYPSTLIWEDAIFGEPHISYGRIGDIDGDGIKDITFLCSRFDPWRIAFFENNGNNQYIGRNPIVWQSGGPVDYSFADFDDDGRNEIISALAPTGIMMYEYIANDSFAPVWQTDIGCPNPYLHDAIGDNNNNGYGEWVSCGRDFSRSGFFFKVFEAVGDNQYQVVYYDSLPGDCWEAGGLAHGDIDNDGRNEFMVSANSNIGLYKYDTVSGWHRIWLCDDGGFATTYPFLLDVDNDGECEIVLSGELLRVRIYDRQRVGIRTVENIGLFQPGSFPNPFNSSVEIKYTIPIEHHVSITIFDILGQKIRTLVEENQQPGYQSASWDGRNDKGEAVSSGIYHYRLSIADMAITRKMTLLK